MFQNEILNTFHNYTLINLVEVTRSLWECVRCARWSWRVQIDGCPKIDFGWPFWAPIEYHFSGSILKLTTWGSGKNQWSHLSWPGKNSAEKTGKHNKNEQKGSKKEPGQRTQRKTRLSNQICYSLDGISLVFMGNARRRRENFCLHLSWPHT